MKSFTLRSDALTHTEPSFVLLSGTTALGKWDMNFSDLKFISKIGGGSGGQVFKARYVTETVAVKQVFSSMMDENNLGEDSRLPPYFRTLVSVPRYPCFGLCVVGS